MEVEEQEYADTGAGVMVSNLPLLFSRGSPSSLHHMTLSELEVFVPFMVRCSVGEDRPVAWAQLPRPTWWPKKLPFRMPTTSNSHTTRLALVSLVEKCYSFHGCEYLLQFCASLVAQMPSSGYRFNDNRDGTTSMYHGTTGKLLVTFRNENRDYDKFSHDRRGRDATRKLLLSPSSHHSHHGGERRGSTNGTSTAMFQPPPTDIYLCDKCESEFYSLREVQNHERQCCGDAPPSPAVPSPDPEPMEEDPQPDAQIPFLAYFKLRPAEHTGLAPYTSPRKKTPTSPPRRLSGPLYPRYESVPLSSPLGKFLFANSKFRNKYQVSQLSVMRYERHLPATPNTEVNFKERCHNRWLVVWRGRKDQPPWVHLYCFNRAQRRERLMTINTGLDLHSRRLLRLCHPSTVKLKRLQKRLVNRLLRLGGPSAPCIDLTEEPHLQPSLAQSPQNLVASQPAPWNEPGVMQWVTGLPQSSSDLYLPGASGIITPAALNSSLTVAQLALPSSASVPAPQHSSPLNIISVGPADSRLLPQQHVIHPAVSQKIPLAHFSNKHQHNRSLGMSVDDNNLSAKPGTSLSADISLIPLNSINKSLSYQVSSDVMKPLSRKKFAMSDPQLHIYQKSGVSNQRKGEVQASLSGSGMPILEPIGPNSAKSGQSMYHLLPQRDANTLPMGNSVTLSNLTQARMNSSIEIIDLSSDEDDLGRGRGRNEADNAPQQLDGLSCYPHTGAKVPDSTQFSSSKNGNSHWSSTHKSRCGTGRGGDLATNGRSPNVPPSSENSPVPNSLFLPITAIPPPPTQGPKIKGNSRKRKMETTGMSSHGGKTIILDISRQGVQVSQGQLAVVSKQLAQDSQTSLHKDGQQNHLPEEVFPITPEDINNIHSTVDMDTSHLRASEQNGAFENPKITYESSNMFIVDEDISFKSPVHIDADITHDGQPVNSASERVNRRKENGTRTDPSNQDSVPSYSNSGSGFITNIVNTVSKGVKFFRSLVGGSNDTQYTSVDALTLKEYNVSDQKTQDENASYSYGTREISGSSMLLKKKKCSEVNQLLQDECRELRLNGLMDLRHPDLENIKVTRRSVERFMPAKAPKGHRPRHNKDEIPSNKHKVKSSNVSSTRIERTDILRDAELVVLHKDSYSSCMDENGNSASYPTLSPDRQSVEKCQKNAVAQKLSTDVLSECNWAPSDIGECGKGQASLSFEKCSEKELTVFNKIPMKSTLLSDINRGNDEVDIRNTSNCESNKESADATNKNYIVGTEKLCSVPEGKWENSILKDFHPADRFCEKVGQVQCQPDTNFLYYDVTSQLCDVSKEEGSRTEYSSSQLFLCPVVNTLGKPELTGETAEECGAWQAQFPQSQPSPNPAIVLSPANTPSTPPKNKRPLLLHTLRRPTPPFSLNCINAQSPSPHPSRKSRKPRHKSVLRELRDLVTDEWKEIRGSGFHPSDLLGSEEVKFLSASSDEDDSDFHLVSSKSALSSMPVCKNRSSVVAHSKKKRPLLLHSMKRPSQLLTFTTLKGTSTLHQPPRHLKKVKPKNKRLLRELSNLATDEWKEIRGSGFHPSDLVGTEEVNFLNSSSDEDDGRMASDSGFTPPESPLEKVSNLEIGETERKLPAKLHREVAMLLLDECKELRGRKGKLVRARSELSRKARKHNPRQLKSTRQAPVIVRNLRTYHSAVGCGNLGYLSSALRAEDGSLSKMWPLMRNTRSQASATINCDTPTPRSSHRQILQAETAMCVLNYKLPNIN